MAALRRPDAVKGSRRAYDMHRPRYADEYDATGGGGEREMGERETHR